MQQLTAPQLKEWIQQHKDFLLLDIREGWEHDLFNIGGEHIPMGQIIERITEIPKDKEVVLYCEKGIRSVITIQRLEGMGFNNLYNLAGGVKAWKE